MVLGAMVEHTPYSSASSAVSKASGQQQLGRNLRVCWCATRTSVHADPIVTVSSGD